MRLKNAAILADGVAMFSETNQPLAFSEACLQSLSASLNAPVVHVDGLPAGPARAAVVVYAEQYGDLGMAVAVRSLEGGEVVVMRAQEPLPPDADPARAREMALSYGEGLGFVFDDDMLGDAPSHETRLAALAHWQKLVGSDEVFAAPDVASPPSPKGARNSSGPERMPETDDLLSAAADGAGGAPVDLELEELSLSDIGADEIGGQSGELLLDDIAPLEIDDGDHALELDTDEDDLNAELAAVRRRYADAGPTEPEDAGAAPTSQSDAAFAESPLSKFRRPEEDADGAAETDAGGSALGRVKIVRMKQSKDGRAPARARVLASY